MSEPGASAAAADPGNGNGDRGSSPAVTPPPPPARAAPGPVIKTPAGDAPVIPIGLILLGAYLAWFGIHYWRDQVTIWPSDPVKDILQGKGLPRPVRSPPAAAAAGTAQAAAGPAPGSGSTIGISPVTGEAMARDEQQYAGKIRYLWGGSSPATGWDCSGMQNWCLGHDLGLDIPGYRGGTYTGAVHGPDVAQWIAWAGVEHHAGTPQPGDLVCWGPNEHMGLAISATEMISAEDPAHGTRIAPIRGFLGTAPVILRLKAIGTLGGPASAAANQRAARLLAARYGWSPGQDAGQWSALVALWTKESNWSVTATNPVSGAYGIPQASPGSKMARFGKNWQTSAVTQITWGLWYIKDRYGTPAAAWAHEQAHGWY